MNAPNDGPARSADACSGGLANSSARTLFGRRPIGTVRTAERSASGGTRSASCGGFIGGVRSVLSGGSGAGGPTEMGTNRQPAIP